MVKSRIIENWESQDEPEHLRTIRDRVLSNEQRAGYLLELYRQIWDSGEVAANNNEEEAILKLSGLVVKQGEKLRVYNRIYREVFNQDWIGRELGNLRPYSEAFRAWVASGEQDESRLLHGGALQEAQAWAKGKNLSYLDQQFLAACEKKKLEQQMAVADKEAQLERERKDREAAEARSQALAEANRKAKRRIQIGAAVLIVAVLGAVISGVLAGNKVNEANSQVANANEKATQARKREKNAQVNEKRMQANAQQAELNMKQVQARATEAEAREKDLKQKATEAGERLASAHKKAQQATEQSQQAQLALKQAQESAKAAKSRVQALNQQKEKTAQDLNRAKTDLQSAQKEAIVAQANVENAKQGEEQANKKLAEAQTARQKVEADIQNVSQLSQLAAQLQNQGLSPQADEAWNQASRVPNIKDDKLKQAMLFASISLAHQQLAQQFKERDEQEQEQKAWDEAKTTLDESLKNLQQLPKADTSVASEQWAILVHVRRVQGSLLKEQGNTKGALKAYTEAFDTLKAAWSKLPPVDTTTEIPIKAFLPDKQQILSASAVENLHREFLKILSQNQANQQKISEVKQSLQAHLFAELNYLMTVPNWKDADRKTSVLMLNIADKEKQGFLVTESIKTFSCPALRTIDTLWVKYSEGTFGFSVQKRILDEILAASAQPNRSYTQVTQQEWIKWTEEVGWKGKGENYLSYNELTFNPKKAKQQGHQGHLPALGAFGFWEGFRVLGVGFGVGWGGVGVVNNFPLSLRLVDCSTEALQPSIKIP